MRALVAVAFVVVVTVVGCGGSEGHAASHTKIVFAAEGGLVAVRPANGKTEMLPYPQSGVSDFSWSPDGEKIAWLLDEQLFVTNDDGGSPTLVVPSASAGLWAWSPDGQRIAYTYSDMGVARADGTDRRVLVRCREECGMPAWSPDSEDLAIQLGGGLEIVDVDDGQRHLLVRCVLAHCATPPCGGYCGSAAWSPDKKWIAFVAQASDDEGLPNGCGLSIVGSDGKHLQRITQPTNNRSLCISISWSPDGKLLALDRIGPSAVALYRRSGDDWRAVRVIEDADAPAWSADGKRFAYLRHDFVLWVADANGDHPRRIGDTLDFDWSPDGTQLVVAHGRASPETGPGPVVMWIVDAATAKHRRLWPAYGTCDCGFPAWQPK